MLSYPYRQEFLPLLLAAATLFLLSLILNVHLLFTRSSMSTSQERECGFLLAQDEQKGLRINNNTLVETQKVSWEHSTTIPMWMKYYIFWHNQQLRTLTPNNYNEQSSAFRGFFILHCLKRDNPQKIACGGASDRLQQVPYALREAYDTKRLLFIKWEKPAPLEAFLEPPPGGLDWRIPNWLDDAFGKEGVWDNYYKKTGDVPNSIKINDRDSLLVGRVGPAGDMTQGAEAYDALRASSAEAPYHVVFHDAWRALFRPVPTIQAKIDADLKRIGLQAGRYVSVHLRAKYLEDHSQATAFIHNAVKCGHQMRRDQPIFVASDSTEVLKEALCFYEKEQKEQQSGENANGNKNYQFPSFVASRHGNCSQAQRQDFKVTDPLHFDNGANFFCTSCAEQQAAQPQDYYDTFVELYLLASGGCVAAGRGGYGVWASRISANASCLVFHAEQDPGSGSQYFPRAATCTGK